MTEALDGAIRPEVERTPGPASQVGVGGRRDTVLVVHSYRSLRQVIAHTLQLQGYDVMEAETPEPALGMLASAAPALVLLEIPLGIDDTVAPTAELARTSGIVGIPVIGLGSRRLSPQEAKPLGIGEMLVMPVPQQDLLAAVRRTLDSERGWTGGVGASGDAQCRLPLGDCLRAEHLSLSFNFPDAERIQLRPGNDRQIRTFRNRLAALGIEPEVEIDGGDLLFRYDSTIADALLIDPEGGTDAVQRHILTAFPSLGLRPEPLRLRLEALAAELRSLRRVAS